MSIKLVFLNSSLDDQQLSTLKLACKVLNVSRQELDNANLFTDVYRLIEQSRPQEALSLVLQILVNVFSCQSYRNSIHSIFKSADYEDDAVDIDGARIDRLILEVMAKRQRCHFCTAKCTICSILLVVLPLILTILSISSFGVFYIGLQHTSLHSVHNIGSNTSVIIEPNCYNSFWIKNVIISNTEGYGNDPVTVTFYKTNVNNLHFTPKQLKGRKERYNPIGVTYRKHMNYLVDVPIYSAGNSTLTYTFSFRADINFTICPLELHMFNNYQKYRRYLQHPYDHSSGPISSPNCTLNSVDSTLQSHIVNFHLHPNTFYYLL